MQMKSSGEKILKEYFHIYCFLADKYFHEQSNPTPNNTWPIDYFSFIVISLKSYNVKLLWN